MFLLLYSYVFISLLHYITVHSKNINLAKNPSFVLDHVNGKAVDLNDDVSTGSAKKDSNNVIIRLDLNETTTLAPSRRKGALFRKDREKELVESIFNPQMVNYGNDAPSMQMDVNLKSALDLLSSILSSQGLNTYADTIARKAADVYTTYRKHSKAEVVKPQVIEFRSGKPSLVYAFSADDILRSVDNFLASTLVRSYTDQLAKKAGLVFRAVVTADLH